MDAVGAELVRGWISNSGGPVPATEWGTRPQGDLSRDAFIFEGDLAPDTDFSDLLQEFEETIKRQQWALASSHVYGSGLQGGADNRYYRQYMRSLESCSSSRAPGGSTSKRSQTLPPTSGRGKSSGRQGTAALTDRLS